MTGIEGWYNHRIEKFRKFAKSQILLFITAKFLGGVAIGLLLAIWLPVWTWWIFLVVALIIAIPIYGALFRK